MFIGARGDEHSEGTWSCMKFVFIFFLVLRTQVNYLHPSNSLPFLVQAPSRAASLVP